jgi:hypothetical protein
MMLLRKDVKMLQWENVPVGYGCIDFADDSNLCLFFTLANCKKMELSFFLF